MGWARDTTQGCISHSLNRKYQINLLSKILLTLMASNQDDPLNIFCSKGRSNCHHNQGPGVRQTFQSILISLRSTLAKIVKK